MDQRYHLLGRHLPDANPCPPLRWSVHIVWNGLGRAGSCVDIRWRVVKSGKGIPEDIAEIFCINAQYFPFSLLWILL